MTVKVTPKTLQLSQSRFAEINWNLEGHQFEFVLEDRSIIVHPVFAEFLSSSIARARKSDCTYCRYVFDAEFVENFGKVFEDLVSSLSRGQALELTQETFGPFMAIAHELDNQELMTSMLEAVDVKTMSLEFAASVLKWRTKLVPLLKIDTDELVSRLASHLYDIPPDILAGLDVDSWSLLLSSPNVKISDEDWLYNVIMKRAEQNQEYFQLLKHVQFEYLSVSTVMEFVAAVHSNNLIQRLTMPVWDQIGRRLSLPCTISWSPPVGRYCGVLCQFSQEEPLNGIIAYMTRKYGGNLHNLKIVTASASGYLGENFPANAISLAADTVFLSSPVPNSWLSYDFGERLVCPTNYTIRSWFRGRVGAANLKSWVIEGSLDGETWDILDRRKDDNHLNDRNAIGSFDISPKPERTYRFIRLRQTDKTHSGEDNIQLCSFEIFGTLFE